jgi:aspartate kinase
LHKEKTYKAIKEQVKPEASKLLVAQGFIGSSPSGATTTLGRGGSDYTATILGAALNIDEVQIWTDVTGIMTTDPRLIKKAKTIPELSYEEAAELSYFGARVIHPSTIQPAVEAGISVWVKNTHSPEDQGSKIHLGTKALGIKAIASKKGITLINVHSSRMLNAYGFLKNIFEVFERYRCSVDLVSTSEVSVSMTIDDQSNLNDIRLDLERFAEVTIEDHKSIVSLVGKDLWKDSRFITRAFSALENIPVRMISLGSSDINLGLVVPENRLDEAVTLLHQEMFEKQ